VLGLSSPSETLDVYTHLWLGDDERTRDAIAQGTAAWMKASKAQ